MRIVIFQEIIDVLRGKKKDFNFKFLQQLKFDFAMFKNYLYNYWITYFPSCIVRHWYLRNILGYKIGKGCFVHLGCFFSSPNLEIGDDTVIGRYCQIDGRIKIGSHTSITAFTVIQAAAHYNDSDTFEGCESPIEIGDYVWTGIRCVILPGVHIKNGAIVGANSTVTHDVEEFSIVAGSPAREIKKRSRNAQGYNLCYRPKWN